MKTLLRFDARSVLPAVVAGVLRRNPAIRQVDDDVYLYEYDPVVLSHALLLLGQNPVRFGYDLSHYLSSAALFYSHRGAAQRVTVDFGTSDFKKRMAEDVAIGQASMFMTASYGIQWQTIAQIPENRRLSKMRPDFEGFEANGDRSLFEVKGTTVTRNAEPAVARGVDQVKRYPEPAVRKMVIASYFSCDSRCFPNFMFVIDPEVPDVVLPDRDTAISLHHMKILEFLQLDEARKLYCDYLRNHLAANLAERNGTSNTRARTAGDRAKDEYLRSMSAAIRDATTDSHGIMMFYRGKTEVDHADYEIVLGIVGEVMESISQLTQPTAYPRESHVKAATGEAMSTLTDGTVFRIRQV